MPCLAPEISVTDHTQIFEQLAGTSVGRFSSVVWIVVAPAAPFVAPRRATYIVMTLQALSRTAKGPAGLSPSPPRGRCDFDLELATSRNLDMEVAPWRCPARSPV